MLISFSLENWMSFRDRVTFSMVASRERPHGTRIPRLNRYKARILPIAAIHGGNASGKTCFVKALNFARLLVVKGNQPESPIPVEPFRLDDRMIGQPSRFCFELLVQEEKEGEKIYEFSFAVTSKEVVEEKLVVIDHCTQHWPYTLSQIVRHRHRRLQDRASIF